MTQKQLKFMTCLLECSTTAKAIKASGVAKSTAYLWMKNPEFKEELQRRKSEMLGSVSNYLQSSLSVCCEELLHIVKDQSTTAQVKINAISLIFQNARSFTEQTEILERISRLEEEMKEGEEY